MHLHSLYVENYRAVKKALITFDSTTVLIGENESGKSSLLHVLKKVLNPEKQLESLQFKHHHFHRNFNNDTIAGPIRIKICFEEQEPNEWRGTKYQLISTLLKEDSKIKRKLTLDIKALPAENEIVHGSFKIYIEGSTKHINNENSFLWIQKMNPVIHLSAGMLTGHGVEHLASIKPAPSIFDEPPEIQQAVNQIESSAELLINGHSLNNRKTIEEGYQAAHIFITHFSRKTENENKPKLAQKISDILGKEQSTENGNINSVLSGNDSTAKKLGILLLIAALLRTPVLNTGDDVDPVWIIEDPEAHLHPMTLVSAILLIDAVRWQKIITTYSSEFLSKVPLKNIRRIHRSKGVIQEYKVKNNVLSRDDLRKISYHLRAYNNEAFFARLWLFVEGESEFWIIPQLARFLNYNFSLEGINCIVFAQSGITPFIKVAEELGIEWHILVDGDDAGHGYMNSAKQFTTPDEVNKRITLLRDRDIEHCFWNFGYADFYLKHAKIKRGKDQNIKPNLVIKRAVKHYSKPYLSLSITDAIMQPDSPGIPDNLQSLIQKCVALARSQSSNEK